MLIFLYLGSLGLIFFRLYRKNICNGEIKLDFNLFFTAGFLYYLFIPFGFICVFPGENVYKYFNAIYQHVRDVSESRLIVTLLSIDAIYFFMMFFSVLHANYSKNGVKVRTVKTHFYQVIFMLVLLIFTVFLYGARDLIGRGYYASYSVETRGPLTFAAHFTVTSLLMYLEKRNRIQKSAVTIVLLIQFIVMTTGTRMEAITTFIGLTLAILHLKGIKAMKVHKMITGTVIIAVFMTFVGIVRSGFDLSDISGAFFRILFGEAVGANYSLFASIGMNKAFPLMSNPLALTLLFVNIIPSFIFPAKAKLYSEYIYNGTLKFINPYGGISLHTSVLIFFGLLGIPLFCLLFSLMLRYIRRISEFIYYDTIGMCTFVFFRNGFDTTIVKGFVENCTIFPLIIILIGNTFDCTRARNKYLKT